MVVVGDHSQTWKVTIVIVVSVVVDDDDGDDDVDDWLC